MLGLLGGFGHCVGMCSPFVLFVSRRYVPPGGGRPTALAAQGWCTAGRIVTYAVQGAAAGALGGVVELAGGLLGAAAGRVHRGRRRPRRLGACRPVRFWCPGSTPAASCSAASRARSGDAFPDTPSRRGSSSACCPAADFGAHRLGSARRRLRWRRRACRVRPWHGAGPARPVYRRRTPRAQPAVHQAAVAAVPAGDGALVPVDGIRLRVVIGGAHRRQPSTAGSRRGAHRRLEPLGGEEQGHARLRSASGRRLFPAVGRHDDMEDSVFAMNPRTRRAPGPWAATTTSSPVCPSSILMAGLAAGFDSPGAGSGSSGRPFPPPRRRMSNEWSAVKITSVRGPAFSTVSRMTLSMTSARSRPLFTLSV